MAFHGTLLLCVSLCVLAKDVLCFVDLVCVGGTVGELGHQSMLNCIIKPKPGIKDVNIITVVWKKMNANETTVLYFKTNTPFKPESSYNFAEPSWKEDNMNVSLLITSTKLEDEGEYTCDVITDSGRADKTKTRLNVTAKYNEPVVSLTEEKETSHAVCIAQGGYPAGNLHWFDENGNNWTNSADFKAEKMKDGLYKLSSKLPLLPGSTSSEYTCIVLNSSEGEEHKIVFKPPKNEGKSDKSEQLDSSISKILAPVIVIGSLIVGLLLLLIYRRRSNQVRRPSSTPFLDPGQQCPTDELDYVAP